MAKVQLSVFQLPIISDLAMKQVVRELHREPGYGEGIYIREHPEIPLAYQIEVHNGEITSAKGLIRIVHSQIWTGKFANMVESALRQRRIPYELARIMAEYAQTIGRDAKPFNLDQRIEVRYTPCKQV